MILKGIIFFSVMTVVVISTYSFAASITASGVNELKIFNLSVSSPETLTDIDLGTGSTISSVLLTFRNNLANNTTVDLSIKNSTGTEIGSGSKTLSSATSSVTIDLTDTVSAAERPDLEKVTVTVT